jgi:hypothetical protein
VRISIGPGGAGVNARREAADRLGGRFEARVLEPSPPAVADPPFFADDPVARGDVPAGRQVVSPVAGGDLLWADLAADDPGLAAWCADRWLAAWRRLGPAPEGLEAGRTGLHRLAEHVISPARQRSNGKIGLRFTRGGFGTPCFGADVQVRVQEAELVVDTPAGERRAGISSLAAAAAHLGPALLPPGEAGAAAADDVPLGVPAAAAEFLGEWFGFAASALEALRAGAPAAADPGRVQLWPEHFDLAVELGAEAAGRRAAYGCSPGDELHPEPYLYVAPWEAPPEGALWNATAFRGADLPFAELLAAPDQRAAALAFFSERLGALAG